MGTKRVLIVEDETDTRRGLQEFLERHGYLALGAGDGLAGLAQAERWHPHAILLDIRMPGLDGYEVCRRLKANAATQPTPVIVLTGGQDEAVNRRAYEVGARACLAKPFRLEAPLTILQTAIADAERQAMPKATPKAKPA